MSGFHFFHVFVLGMWGGCVAAEMVMEIAAFRDASLRAALASFHDRIDRYVEIPILIAVVTSGVLLLMRVPVDSQLLIKVGFASLAVLANAACVVPVVRRAKAAEAHDETMVLRYSRQVIVAFAIGFPSAAVALALGLSRTLPFAG